MRGIIGFAILTCLLLLLSSCGEKPVPEDKYELNDSLCESVQRILLDPRHNWEIVPADYADGDAYLKAINLKIRACQDSLSSLGIKEWNPPPKDEVSWGEEEDTAALRASEEYYDHEENFYLPIYRWIDVKGVKVSLRPVMKPSGGGYALLASVNVTLYADRFPDTPPILGDTVRKFFLQVWDHPEVNWIIGSGYSSGSINPIYPRILTDMNLGFEQRLEYIIKGYLLALETRALKHYGSTDLCSLTSVQADSLREQYGLVVHLNPGRMKRGSTTSPAASHSPTPDPLPSP